MGEFSPRSVSFVGVRKKDLLTSQVSMLSENNR
jgi:hypothetical protein